MVYQYRAFMNSEAVSHLSAALCSLIPETALTLFIEVKEWVFFQRRSYVGKLQGWRLFSKCVRDLLHSIDVATKAWQPISWSVDKI